MERRINVPLVAAAAFAAAFTVHAGEIGHFNRAVMNIRDYVMPDPGWYTAIYNYLYMTDQLNNSNGDAINSVIIKASAGPGIKLGVNVDYQGSLPRWFIRGERCEEILSGHTIASTMSMERTPP